MSEGGEPGQVARALALVAWRTGAEAGLQVLGEEGARARALVASWRAAGPAGVRAADSVAVELRAPRPTGWRSIDPSWLDAAVATEAPAVRDAVRALAVAEDSPRGRWCARWLFGERVPMPADAGEARAPRRLEGPNAVAGPHDLARLPAPALAQALAWLGRRQLAHALGAADRDARGAASALATLAAGPPWGRELIDEARAVAALGDRADERLGPRRVVVARAGGLARGEATAPVQLGARAIAATVAAHADLAAQLAQRLPRRIGLVLAAELAGDHGAPVSAAELIAALRRASGQG